MFDHSKIDFRVEKFPLINEWQAGEDLVPLHQSRGDTLKYWGRSEAYRYQGTYRYSL